MGMDTRLNYGRRRFCGGGAFQGIEALFHFSLADRELNLEFKCWA